MNGTKTRTLSPQEWDALAKAEEPLYRGDEGLHPYTSCMTREDSEDAAVMWDNAEMNVSGTAFGDDDEPSKIEAETARRVAFALSILAGGVGYFSVPQ